jgi:hypothetical protein
MSAVAGGTETGARRPASARSAVGARIALLLVGAAQAEVGIWGLIAPKSFFRQFPGGGHHWVSELGVYNEHLVRDYAATELGFAVLLIAAAIWFERRLVLTAGAAFLVATIPHFAYHLTTTGSFSTPDNAASLGSFVLEIVLVGGSMIVAARATSERSS